MKALIVGYGSMGRRRIRLTTDLVCGIEFICVDKNPERLKQAEKVGIRGYASLEDGIRENPDIAFVCTSPGYHADIILYLVAAGVNVFTELNLTNDRYDQILDEAKKNKVIVFMSSTMMYKRQIEMIDELVKQQKKPLTYIYHVGQYLPDWHPWESYKDFFVGKKETNGVREILAVQIPWIVNTFGRVANIHAEKQKCTELDVDFPDSIILCIRHKNGNIGIFAVDVVSRKAATRLEIIGEDLHLIWNGHNDDLLCLNIENGEFEQINVYESANHVEGYADNIVEEPYRDEIIEFFEVIRCEKKPKYSLEHDAYVLSIIDKIEGM